MYNPAESAQMTTPLRLQQPLTAVSYGVNTKTWKNVSGVIMANFKTYGGTERSDNGVVSIEDTAQVVCRYRPDVKSNCRVVLLDGTEDSDGAKIYEILGEPENIEMRNKFLKFKVRRVKGGA
ncbi:MAG: head-tail adaptor protein [Acutalibacteraceae bacterium]